MLTATRTSPMQNFVSSLFQELETQCVSVRVLRGEQNLAALDPGSDIDLVVEPRDLQKFFDIFDAVRRRSNVQLWERFRAGFLTQSYLHARTEDGEHEFFEIDVHTSEACFGVPFLSARQLREHPEARLVANLLTPFLSGGVLEARYCEPLTSLENEARECAQSLLDEIFGARHAAQLWRHLESASTSLNPKSYRKQLWLRAFARRPFASTMSAVKFAFGIRIAPLFRPRGKFFAVLGTDGTGKSTLVDQLRERMRPVFREGGVRVFHMRPGLLPQLRSLVTMRKKVYTAEEISNPHNSKPSGFAGSCVRVLYYWTDFVLGYFARVLPTRRRNSLVLFDRYFDDYQVDPRRARIQENFALARWLAPWTPRPEKVLVCTTDLETVQKRKQEHTPEESARQLAAYEKLAQTSPSFYLVQTGDSIETTVNRALDVMFEEPSR